MSLISVVTTEAYEDGGLDQAVERHFLALGLEKKIPVNGHVVIKPNLLMKRKPEEFTTTHPEVVAAVIRKLQSMGVTRITIADSPGGPYTKPLLMAIYEAAGYTRLAEVYGVTLNTDVSYSCLERKENCFCKSFQVIQPLVEADYIINICKLKTHGMTGLSGAVKNMFGSVPGLMKPELHLRFSEKERFCGMLVDLCQTVAPNVTFVDAVDAMEGDGPSGGTKRHVGMTLASENPYDLDFALCQVTHLDPHSILTMVQAIKQGLCVSSAEELEIVGDELKTFPDFRKASSNEIDFSKHAPKFIIRWFSPKPMIQKKGCIGCGKCAESCPAHTIRIDKKKAKIDYSHCIKCYCCHEMCPVKTIKIHRTRLFDFGAKLAERKKG